MKPGEERTGKRRFALFRRDDPAHAPLPVALRDTSEVARRGMARIFAAGAGDGFDARELFDGPGFNLARAWIKHGYPMPLHSHEADCLYYVAAGSVKVGTELLGAGDGFFVPGGTPYTFAPGRDGVELLEFRHQPLADVRILQPKSGYWAKALATVDALRSTWQAAKRPG